jgi:hypothetical protein
MLCTRQTCLVVFFSFSSLKQQSAAKHVTPFSILFWNNQSLLNLLNVLKQPVSAQSPECCMFWNNQSLLNLLNAACSETTSLCSISWILHVLKQPVSAQSPEFCMFWNNQSLLNLLNAACSETTSLCSISWNLHVLKQPVSAQSPECCMLSGKATNTNSLVWPDHVSSIHVTMIYDLLHSRW